MKDFLLDENGDLLIEDGDFLIADATTQHQRDLLIANKGEYKEHPEVGIGINELLNDDNPRHILTSIKRNLEHIGQKVHDIELKGSNIKIDAKYEQ